MATCPHTGPCKCPESRQRTTTTTCPHTGPCKCVGRKKIDKKIDKIVALFWTYNAAVKDENGVVHIVGRTSFDQEPPLTKRGRLKRSETDANA